MLLHGSYLNLEVNTMTQHLLRRMVAAIGVVIGCTAAMTSAHATLTLSAGAVTDGFSITTFASGIGPGGCCSGPFGIAITANGNVVVSANNSTRYAWANADGQNPG